MEDKLRDIAQQLTNRYHNLYFSKYNSIWVRRYYSGCDQYTDGASVQYKFDIANITKEDLQKFQELNDKAELAVRQSDKYFWCSECNNSHLKENFSAQVFAGVYCKECAKKPAIAKIIKESKKPGFYN